MEPLGFHATEKKGLTIKSSFESVVESFFGRPKMIRVHREPLVPLFLCQKS